MKFNCRSIPSPNNPPHVRAPTRPTSPPSYTHNHSTMSTGSARIAPSIDRRPDPRQRRAPTARTRGRERTIPAGVLGPSASWVRETISTGLLTAPSRDLARITGGGHSTAQSAADSIALCRRRPGRLGGRTASSDALARLSSRRRHLGCCAGCNLRRDACAEIKSEFEPAGLSRPRAERRY